MANEINGNGNGKKTWQRLALSVFGITVIWAMWERATNHLYSLPVTSIPGFTSITTNDSYVIGAIVVFMVTGKLIYDWKNSTASTVIQQAETMFRKAEVTVTEKYDPVVERKFAEKYAGDTSYRPPSTVPEEPAR